MLQIRSDISYNCKSVYFFYGKDHWFISKWTVFEKRFKLAESYFREELFYFQKLFSEIYILFSFYFCRRYEH